MSARASGSRLRIAVLTRVFAPCGGAERYAVALVQELAPLHEVHVFAQHFGADCADVAYHRVPRWFSRPRWLNQLWFALYTWWRTRSGFDIVHSHENTWHGNVQTVHVRPLRLGLFAAKQGVHLWMRCLQVLTSPRLWTYLALEAARMKPRPGRIVIAVSDTLRRDIGATYGCLQPLAEVVPPGVAPAAPIDDRMATRQALGLADDARILLFIACDYQKKGLAALLDALAVLPASVVLVVVGNSNSSSGFERQAAALGVAGRVRFTGMLPDPGPMYRAAEMLVHPTLEDTFGMVVLEAMAYGLPVVVSDERYCGIAATFTDAHDALLLTDPRDSRAIAAAVLRLLDDGELRAHLAAAGRKQAQRSDWVSVCAQHERIYRRAADSTLPTGTDEQYDVASRVTTSRT